MNSLTSCELCGADSTWEYFAPKVLPLRTFTTGPQWQTGDPPSKVSLCTRCVRSSEALIQLHGEMHGTGCCLHIVTDDGNVSNNDVEFCIRWAIDHEHTFCEEVARRILELPVDERRRRWGTSMDEEEL